MKRTLLAAMALTMMVSTVFAQETRTITDHAGFEVTYPAEPLRIVSLHDWSATVMAYELGANLIGSSGRLDNSGEYFIRSGRELYDLGFGEGVELASVHGELDMERIASLQPDLIIGNVGDTLEYREQLALIAPTIMFDPANGQDPIEQYAEFAGWLGKDAKFDELHAAYEARAEAAKATLLKNGTAPSYVALMPNPEDGDLRIFRVYGAQTAVLDDLGFTHAALVDTIPATEQDGNFSAEVIGQLDTAYIFTTHISDRGEDQEAMMAQLDTIAPGYRNLLPAVKNNRFISMSRFHVFPTTFAAMNYVLDQLEKTGID